MKKSYLLCSLAVLCGIGMVHAGTPNQPNIYLGFGLSEALADNPYEGQPGVEVDNQAAAYRGIIGYSLLPNLAIEAGYISFGEFSATMNTPFGSATESVSLSSPLVGVKAYAYKNREWGVFGKAGLPYYGGGVSWYYGGRGSLNMSFERYQVNEAAINSVSLELLAAF